MFACAFLVARSFAVTNQPVVLLLVLTALMCISGSQHTQLARHASPGRQLLFLDTDAEVIIICADIVGAVLVTF